MDYVALGQRIRKIRRQRDFTQAELAEKLGISTSFIGHIERGTRVLSMATFVQLCSVLDTDPNTLLSAEKMGNHWPTALSKQEKEQLCRLLEYGAQLVKET